MSPAFNGEGGLTAVEIEVLAERLKGIEGTLARIEEKRLARIEEQMMITNGRIGKVENWQAATDPVLEVMNERIDINSDVSEKSKEWISEQKGWNSGRTQMIVQICMLIGMAVTLIKILFFHS